jgi:uncharacterized membrane protein
MTCEQMGEMMAGMMGQMGGGTMGGRMMGGAMLWLGVISLAVILVVGLAVAVAISRRPASPADDPHEILRRRFAHGELSAEEYAAAQRTLGRT